MHKDANYPSYMQTIGLDFDDVIMDFNTRLAVFHNIHYGTSYNRDDILSFELQHVWKCSSDEVINRVLEFYQSDLHASAAPMPGAISAIQELKKKYQLAIITSRPDAATQVTLDWIERHLPHTFDSIEFTNHFGTAEPKRTKREVCDTLDVHVFVDDSLANALDVASPTRQALLLNMPWNQGNLPQHVTRVHSWDDIRTRLG